MSTTVTTTKRESRFVLNLRKYGLLYLMTLPGLAYLLINNYLPMAGLVIAFKDVDFRKGLFGSDWIGFKNFEYLFASSDALQITRNTLAYNAVFIIVNTVVAVMVAVLLADISGSKIGKFYQSSILLPYLISMVIISYIAQAFLNTERGFLNNSVLALFGADPIKWYTEPKYWPFILVFIKCWQQVGYLCVIYLSSILGIDKEYYEVSYLEGATKLQQIRDITLPLIQPTIIMMVLLSIGRIFYSDFGLFYHVPMNSGALYSTTNVIDTYVYRGLMQLGDIAMSSAAGCYQSLVGFVLVMISNLVVKKISPENALF